MSKRSRRDEVDPSPLPMKKNRKAALAAAKDAKLQECSDILDEVRNAKSTDDRMLSDSFLRAPSRRANPEYYKCIETPIDLTRIQQKVRTEEYPDVRNLQEDMQSLVDNAKSYYKKSSQEYKDACDLWQVFLKAKDTICGRSQSPQVSTSKSMRDASPAVSHTSFRSISPSNRSVRSKDASPGRLGLGNEPADPTVIQQLLASVLTLTDETGRLISPPFRHLPNKQQLPEYFASIKNPIDLKMIAENIDAGQYTNLNSIEKDLLLMCRNAKVFNEPGSMIHKDSNLLRKFILEQKVELLEKASEPLTGKMVEDNHGVVQELLESVDSVEGEHSEDSEEDEVNTSKSRDPMYRLYWALRNYEPPGLAQGPPADAFVSLPSRQCYSDYYDEVPNPISLYMINKRIKSKSYAKFDDMVKDVNIMFENAKSYNLDGSEIHKHACILQLFGNMVARELDPTLDLRAYPVGRADQPMTPSKSAAPIAASTPVPRRKRTEDPDKRRGKPGRKTMGELMSRYRDKLMEVYNAITAYKEADRWLAEVFIEKPVKSEYPDYYTKITSPMDLTTIKEKIEDDQYDTSEQLGADMTLMLNNAKQYNEEHSDIYKDAIVLQNVTAQALKSLGPSAVESPRHIKEKFGWAKATLPAHQKRNSAGGATPGKKGSAPSHKSEQDKMVALLDDIKNYTDSRGRRLALIFLQLPSRKDYPDYFEVIRKPIDLQRIQARLSQSQYENMEALVQDCTLMFDNACRYNEPDSIIYKDALTLQRVLLQRKNELRGGDRSSRPDAPAFVQEMLKNLFITVYNHQDSEGRCYVDSLAELCEINKALPTNKQMKFVALDVIKRHLDKGRYRRLDRFQEDMFNTFKCARLINRTDSQIFEDSIEMQAFLISTRDELCDNGVLLSSPALNYTDRHFINEVEELRMNKLPTETQEDAAKKEDPSSAPSKKKDGDTELSSVVEQGISYNVGDFCYVQSSEKDQQPNIIRIERIWRDESNKQILINGNWFYQPHQTYHLATRKFLEKERFKSMFYDNVTVNRLQGKCYVMFVRDYFKYKPKEFNEADVYVCESRYLGRQLHFKKIKMWPYEDEHVDLEERSEALIARRVPSKEIMQTAPTEHTKVEEEDTDTDEEDNDVTVIDKQRVEVVCSTVPDGGLPGCTYYEQARVVEKWWLRLGDCVLVANDKPLPDIVRVDKIWRTAKSDLLICGQWFARPCEVEHEPSRMFYRREVFCTERTDVVHSQHDLLGLAHVLPLKDYIAWRPTEVVEDNLFVCQSRLNAREASVGVEDSVSRDSVSSPQPAAGSEANERKMKSLKAYKLGSQVIEDEFYYFKKPIQPEKVPSPLLEKIDTTVDVDNIDEFNESASEFDRSEHSLLKESKSWLAGQPKLSNRSKSGYILFSAEVRKKVMQDNPGCPFGEISKLVGVEWKKLSEEGKKEFEMRAQVIAEERQRVDALKKPSEHSNLQPGQYRVFCCKWRDCTWQFATPELLYEHATQVHTSQIAEAGENQFVCYWTSCVKYHKGGKAFPSLPRLHRHIKEKHVAASGKNILPHQRSKYFNPPDYFPEPAPPAPVNPSTPQPTSSPFPNAQQAMTPGAVVPTSQAYYPQSMQGTEGHSTPGGMVVQTVADPGRTVIDLPIDAQPVFVAPPNSQKIQRVLHSETYLRYIETLHAQPAQSTITRFNRYLSVKPTSVAPPEPGKPGLPLSWFGGVGQATKDQVVKAVVKLRDHMMQDTFAISKVIDQSQW